MLIVNNRIIPFGKSYVAINLFGVVFAKEKLSVLMIRHEMIHTAQQKELLFVFFYVFYVVEWIYRLLFHRNLRKAYRSISFEREAYNKQAQADYLQKRRHFAWTEYL